LVVLLGVAALTTDALLILLSSSDEDDWTIIFYRYFLSSATIFFYFGATERERLVPKIYAIGWYGLFASAIWAASSILFTLAILHTHVANVLVIMATNSLFALVYSWFIFGEIIPMRTILTILVCFTSVVTIISIELSGDFDYDSWFGDLCALGSAALTALYLVLVRHVNSGRKKGEEIDMVPCNIVAGAIIASSALIAGADVANASNQDLVYLSLQGVLVLPIGLVCLTIGPKYISAPEVSLFMLLDTILEPIWVYVAGLDTIPTYTIYCGSIVVAALALNATLALIEESDEYEQLALVAENEGLFEEAGGGDGGKKEDSAGKKL
jgi:drug/metabolite transporter (DMT)-like permease